MSIKLTTAAAGTHLGLSAPRVHPTPPGQSYTSRSSMPSVESARPVFSADSFSMDDVALHFISLAFIRISANKVMLDIEAAFSEHYASIQKKVHVRGIVSIILFLIGTIIYDYAILILDLGTNFSSNQTIFRNRSDNPSVAFYLTLGLRFGVIIPLLALNIWTALHGTFAVYILWTWISHVCLGAYPIIYNKLTSDYGVSWFCLFNMYFYSCTPIPFFHMMLFSGLLQLVYAVVMLSGPNAAVTNDVIIREWLYAVLFFVLVSFPRYAPRHTSTDHMTILDVASQSREFAIRVSYMSETMLLFQQNKVLIFGDLDMYTYMSRWRHGNHGLGSWSKKRRGPRRCWAVCSQHRS